jgi:Holliday junction resolvase
MYLLKRQIRGGSKPGIPDIIGVDADGAVCVVEMKNTNADAGVIVDELSLGTGFAPDFSRSM